MTLYCADSLKLPDLWVEADVMITDPPYGTEHGVGYGRSGGHGRPGNAFIANDATTDARDLALDLFLEKPVACFGSPRAPEPPGPWNDRLVWDKREPGLNGGPWRYTHESIFVRGEGWQRTSPSAFSVISVPSGNGTWEKQQHVHAKPVPLMAALVSAAPPRGDRRPLCRHWQHPRCRQAAGTARYRRGAGGTQLLCSSPPVSARRAPTLGSGRRPQ